MSIIAIEIDQELCFSILFLEVYRIHLEYQAAIAKFGRTIFPPEMVHLYFGRI